MFIKNECVFPVNFFFVIGRKAYEEYIVDIKRKFFYEFLTQDNYAIRDFYKFYQHFTLN